MGLTSELKKIWNSLWQSKPVETIRHQVEDTVEAGVRETIFGPLEATAAQRFLAWWEQEYAYQAARVERAAVTARQILADVDSAIRGACGK